MPDGVGGVAPRGVPLSRSSTLSGPTGQPPRLTESLWTADVYFRRQEKAETSCNDASLFPINYPISPARAALSHCWELRSSRLVDSAASRADSDTSQRRDPFELRLLLFSPDLGESGGACNGSRGSRHWLRARANAGDVRAGPRARYMSGPRFHFLVAARRRRVGLLSPLSCQGAQPASVNMMKARRAIHAGLLRSARSGSGDCC
jgi:hypothetical protein